MDYFQNFAGVIGDKSSKAVLLTLEASFGQCRIFHDFKSDASENVLRSEFLNLVCIFKRLFVVMSAEFSSGFLLLTIDQSASVPSIDQ